MISLSSSDSFALRSSYPAAHSGHGTCTSRLSGRDIFLKGSSMRLYVPNIAASTVTSRDFRARRDWCRNGICSTEIALPSSDSGSWSLKCSSKFRCGRSACARESTAWTQAPQPCWSGSRYVGVMGVKMMVTLVRF